MNDYDPHVSMDLHTTNARSRVPPDLRAALNPSTAPSIARLLRLRMVAAR